MLCNAWYIELWDKYNNSHLYKSFYSITTIICHICKWKYIAIYIAIYLLINYISINFKYIKNVVN